MGKNSMYTIRSMAGADSVWEVVKIDDNAPMPETYHISEIGESLICTCPAGSKFTCRHRKMLRLFQAEDRIDKGWMYLFDKDKWFPPQTGD